MKRNLNEIVFTIYISIVLSLVYTAQFTLEPYWLIILFLLSFVVFYLLSRPIFSLIEKAAIDNVYIGIKKERIVVIASFLISVLYLGLWYYYYYPGWFTGDSLLQMSQATSGNYSDWHPVLHTLLTFTIPLTITNGWIGSIVLLQVVEFSLVLAYMVKMLVRHGNIKFAAVVFILVLFNPVTGAIIKQPWKDVALAMLATLMCCYAINIALDKTWIYKPLNVFAVITVSVAASIVRHNAILFTIPMAVCIIHYIKGIQMKIVYVVLGISVFLLIKGPLYSSLNVEKPGNRVTETMGLPMIVIGETVTETPELLDNDVLDFAYSIASLETWKEYYHSGDFNNINFYGGINTAPIDQAGYAGVLKLMLSCFSASPKYAIKGLIDGTKMVYAISGDINWAPDFIPPKILNPILSTPLRYIILYIGLSNITILLLALQRKNGWFSIPLLVHNFGTMVLLTGPDFRFFYLTYPLCWLIIFFLLLKPIDTKDAASLHN